MRDRLASECIIIDKEMADKLLQFVVDEHLYYKQIYLFYLILFKITNNFLFITFTFFLIYSLINKTFYYRFKKLSYY